MLLLFIFSIILDFDRVSRKDSTVRRQQGSYFKQLVPQVPCQPKPRWTWYRNSQLVQEDHRIKITEEGDLVIVNLEISDQGRYKLVAENVYLQTQGLPQKETRQDVLWVDLAVTKGKMLNYHNELLYSHRLPKSINIKMLNYHNVLLN